MTKDGLRSGIPRDPGLDHTWAFLAEGYPFIMRRCARLGTDAFETRLMLQRVVCMLGAEAAREFYTPDRFTRQRAMPASTLMLLQDFRSVQLLDGEAHRQRKQLFLSLASTGRLRTLVEIFAHEWRRRLPMWEQRRRVVLHTEVGEILTRAVCTWAGVPLADADLRRRAREFASMVRGAGGVGPANWRAQALRSRTERWARNVIRAIRLEALSVRADSAAYLIATYRDASGHPLDTATAAIELLNVLRPTVAVARYITFAALALHQHPAVRPAPDAGEAELDAFCEEVRRYYPFFPAIGGRVLVPFTWRGHPFREGDWVLLDIFGTNHDVRTWGDPQRFKPSRFDQRTAGPYEMIPQGGGVHRDTHRCPGEGATVALMKAAVRLLTGEMTYDVPPQDLRVSLRRIPALPASGFVIANTRRVPPRP